MKAPNAWSSSREEPSARAQRLDASSTSTRRPSSSRRRSASWARSRASAACSRSSSTSRPTTIPSTAPTATRSTTDSGSISNPNSLERHTSAERENWDPDKRRDEAPHEAVEERGLEHDQEEQRPERLARLEGVDEDQGGREQQIERDPGHRDDPSPKPVGKGEDDQHEGTDGVEHENRPRRRFVARGEVATGVEELDQRQRHDQEPDEREQPDDPHTPRSVSRASDHSACSLRRSSSPPANRSRSGRCSAPPTLPAARSAFRRR